MSATYRDRRVLITGGSSGIGLALARQSAREGAHVMLVARNPERLEAARQQVVSTAIHPEQRVMAVSMDVTSEALAEQLPVAVSAFGELDLVICCAGVAVAKPFEAHSRSDFQDNFDANVWGTANVIQAVLPSLRRSGGGQVALVGSLGGLLPVWGYSAYSTSKAAVTALSEVLRFELGPEGITVSLIAPPEVDTPMIAAESETVPPQTRFIKDIVGTHDVDDIARHSLRHLARGRPLIIRGFRGRLFYLSQRLAPGLYRLIVAALLRRASP